MGGSVRQLKVLAKFALHRITWTDLGFDDASGMYSEKTDRSKGRQGAAIGAAIVQGQQDAAVAIATASDRQV